MTSQEFEGKTSKALEWFRENHFKYDPFPHVFAEIESDLGRNFVMPRDVNGNHILDLINLADNFLIYGKPGSGKTTLALAIQREYRAAGDIRPLPVYLRFEGGTRFNENVPTFVDRQIAGEIGNEILFQIVYKSWKRKKWTQEQREELVNLMVSADPNISRTVARLREEESMDVLAKKSALSFLPHVPGVEIAGPFPQDGIRKTLETYNFPGQNQMGDIKQKSATETSEKLLSVFKKDWSGIHLIVEIGQGQQNTDQILDYINDFQLQNQLEGRKVKITYIMDDKVVIGKDLELQDFYKFYKTRIDWEDEDLLSDVIEGRLLTASNDDIVSLDQLADPSSRDIERKLANVLIAARRATPREVMILASKVLGHAIKSGNQRITKSALDGAIKEYKDEIAAKLR